MKKTLQESKAETDEKIKATVAQTKKEEAGKV